MNQIVTQLQTIILRPDDIVNYVDLLNSIYPPEAFNEPFIGFKVGMLDRSNMNPKARFDQLARAIPSILTGTNVIIREVPMNAPAGFYLITLPIPKSRVIDAVASLKKVIAILERNFQMQCTKEYQINVSGRCNAFETEMKMNRLSIPSMYQRFMVSPQCGAYRLGQLQRLNNDFVLIRSNWMFDMNSSFVIDTEYAMVLAQLISSIF